MTITDTTGVYYDPYDIAINEDPYPVYERMREEAPLYYNQQHDFYAVSRLKTSSDASAIRPRSSRAGAASSS